MNIKQDEDITDQQNQRDKINIIHLNREQFANTQRKLNETKNS